MRQMELENWRKSEHAMGHEHAKTLTALPPKQERDLSSTDAITPAYS